MFTIPNYDLWLMAPYLHDSEPKEIKDVDVDSYNDEQKLLTGEKK